MRTTLTPSMIFGCLLVVGFVSISGCSRTTPAAGVKKVPAGSEYSGFLKDYAALHPNAKLGGDILTFVNIDQAKHLRRYVAVTVDPVEVYLSASADPGKFHAKAGESLSRYFQRALEKSIADAYPVVEIGGPLVLRMRAAIVGVDTSGSPGDSTGEASERFANAAGIGNVRIEMELVDSVSGERIAAAVDRAALGTNAEVGSYRFERVEKYLAARQAFDEWAARVREFLDSEHELSSEEARRASDSYTSYGVSASTTSEAQTRK